MKLFPVFEAFRDFEAFQTFQAFFQFLKLFEILKLFKPFGAFQAIRGQKSNGPNRRIRSPTKGAGPERDWKKASASLLRQAQGLKKSILSVPLCTTISQCMKMIQNVAFWHFPPIFVLSKLPCLVTLFDSNIQGFWHF